MKFKIFWITLTIFLSTAVVLSIGYHEQVENENGFNRKLSSLKIDFETVTVLPSNYFYFAGTNHDQIYLKDIKQNKLIGIDKNLKAYKAIDISESLAYHSLPKSKLNIYVSQEKIFINNRRGAVSTIDLQGGNIKTFKNPAIRFDQSFAIRPNELAIRQTLIQDKHLSRSISLINLDTKQISNSYPLEKQIDGYFCTDGLLQIDTISKQSFYMYFYRGSILALDSNLKLGYTIKTIDTIKTAKMQVTDIVKENSIITQKNPPKTVNRNFFLDGNHIYILSALKADNETYSNFRHHQVIDVYQLENRKYLFSFYIPKFKEEKVREIRKLGNQLFVISGTHLLKYSIEGGNKMPHSD